MIESLQQNGYSFLAPEYLDPDNIGTLRANYSDVLILSHLQEALVRINPKLSASTIQQAIRDVQQVNTHGDLVACNQHFQVLLTQGIDTTFVENGEERTVKAWLIDKENPSNNNWVVTHQLTIIENGQNKRPDVIIYLNGIPVIVFELKNATDSNATIDKAYQQLQTYHKSIPTLFCYNLLEVISDGLEAKMGTITADISRFMSWKTADGKTTAARTTSELQVMIEGLFNIPTLLDLSLNFIVFEKFASEDSKTKTVKVGVIKKVAAYHQYYAVKKAVITTSDASKEGGNKKGGVVWHTQGSGKSLSMVFFTGLLVQHLYKHS